MTTPLTTFHGLFLAPSFLLSAFCFHRFSMASAFSISAFSFQRVTFHVSGLRRQVSGFIPHPWTLSAFCFLLSVFPL
jgi:hypothetical protein